MPKEAKVLVVEDDKAVRETLKDFLTREGHQVVLEASSLIEALEKVREVSQKGVNLATIDGSLRSGVNTTEDGERVAAALRKEAPGVKIIALSSLEADFGDVNLRKPVLLRDLRKAIEEI